MTVADGTITFNAGAGETNTAVIVKQQTTPVATIYFVGDQNPNVTVTASAAQGCLPTPPARRPPQGLPLHRHPPHPVTSLVENLATATTPASSARGGRARRHDQRRHWRRHPRRRPGKRHLPRRRRAPTASPTSASPPPASRARLRSPRRCRRAPRRPPATDRRARTTRIAADVEGLTGGNGNDTLTGNAGPNTIAGSAPPGTPNVDPQPAGTESRDTINGAGGDDTLLAGDSGTVNGGDGNDTIVGGRSFANVTAVNGGNGDDTLVSGTRQRQPDRRRRVQHPRLRLRQPGRNQRRQSQQPASSSGFPSPGRPAPAGPSAARRTTSSTTTSGP